MFGFKTQKIKYLEQCIDHWKHAAANHLRQIKRMYQMLSEYDRLEIEMIISARDRIKFKRTYKNIELVVSEEIYQNMLTSTEIHEVLYKQPHLEITRVFDMGLVVDTDIVGWYIREARGDSNAQKKKGKKTR